MTSPVCAPKHYAPGKLAAHAHAAVMVPRPFRIASVRWETGQGDVFTWQLHPLDEFTYKCQAGQFNMLYAFGLGEAPVSIAGDCETGPLVHTIRAVGPVTQGMQAMNEGDVIGVRGPFGSTWPLQHARHKDLLIIAGGIGLAPLRPVVYYALRHRADFNKVVLLYGARNPLEMLYREELESWAGDIRVEITVDKAAGYWSGNIGVVTQLLEQIQIDSSNCCAMVCGPEVMMFFCQLALQKLGIPDECIFLSLERNMKCAIGHCGHCQLGPKFICKDGPVFPLTDIRELLSIKAL